MASIRYYDKADVYVGGERVGTALDIKIDVKPPKHATFEATAKSLFEPWPKHQGETPESVARECQGTFPETGGANVLPKPARVEKWQRWRDSRGVEFTVIGPREDVLNTDIYPLRKDGEEGSWRGNNLLGGKNWTFLGYAKPDKVEVGQRWRDVTGEWRVVEVGKYNARISNGTSVEHSEASVMLDSDGWEYLGMSESAEASNQEAVVNDLPDARWPKPCEAMFSFLAENEPDKLLAHLFSDSLSVGMRARAAKSAGRIRDSRLAVAILLPLLSHPQPMIQEGAIYGLSRHLNPDVRERLSRLTNDKTTHEGVKDAATEVLEEHA